MPDSDRLLLMGRFGRPHGVRGEVKVTPETDDPLRFDGLERVFIGASEATARPVKVTSVRFQYPKGRTVVLLVLEGVDSREAAEDLRSVNVYADAADLPSLAEGEAYLHDLIGLSVVVVDEQGEPVGEPIGTVRDLYDGAQLLFAIERPGLSEVLLPDVDEFVAGIDLETRRLFIRPPEGLFE
jgi:16S rRNA processing protein RimM